MTPVSNAAFLVPAPVLPPTGTRPRTANPTLSPRRPTQPPSNALASPPPPTRPPPPSFRPPPSPTPSPSPSPCSTVTGRKALHTLLQTQGADTPVIVFFHARWCRVCKTLAAKLSTVAPLFPHLVWLSVDFADLENKPLCHSLGVRLLPTFRLYRGGADEETDCLEEFTTGPFGWKRLIDRLNEFFEGHPDLQA